MYNIVIIGAGQLGSRHLQSLLKSKEALSISVVDTLQEPLVIAEKRASEIEYGNSKTIVNYYTNYELIPSFIEFAVVATSSVVRLAVIKELLRKSAVRYLLLEKVLFQSLNEYVEAEKLFEEKKVNVWVNCPRRMYSSYAFIKKMFKKNDLLSVSLEAGDWGLGCNAIHYLDIISYLNGDIDYVIDTSKLVEVTDSKRTGYREVLGVLLATQSNGSLVTLSSFSNSNRPSVLKIVSDKVTIIISEVLGSCLISTEENGWKWEEKGFHVEYQSNLTSKVLSELIESGTCSLTPFSESKKIHMSLIKALTEFFNKNGISGCPIT